MQRNYECVLILDVTTSEEEKGRIIQKIKEVLAQNQGEIEKIEEWGKRVLTYPIKKKLEGNYLWFALKGDAGLVKSLDSYSRMNESILRHLILIRKATEAIKIQKVEPREMDEQC